MVFFLSLLHHIATYLALFGVYTKWLFFGMWSFYRWSQYVLIGSEEGYIKIASWIKKVSLSLNKMGFCTTVHFSVSDRGRKVNEFCVMHLIMVQKNRLHLYMKKGKVGADPRAEERVEELENSNDAIKEFAKLFKELTGNEFEPWGKEKKIEKKPQKFYPIDMDDGYDVRYGGLGLRQLGAATTHCKLDPMVANFMKVLCGKDPRVYQYVLMELGHDAPDLPIAMLTDLHIKRRGFRVLSSEFGF